jgi:hypothetical protein
MSDVSGVGRFVDPADEAALDTDTPRHRERDCNVGRNSGSLLVYCQRGERGVARRELPVVPPQRAIVLFVIKRVNVESLVVKDNDHGATFGDAVK